MSGGAHLAVPMPGSSRSCCYGTAYCLAFTLVMPTLVWHVQVRGLCLSCDPRVLKSPTPLSPLLWAVSQPYCPLLGMRTLLCSLLIHSLVWPPAGWCLVPGVAQGEMCWGTDRAEGFPLSGHCHLPCPTDTVQYSCTPLDEGPWQPGHGRICVTAGCSDGIHFCGAEGIKEKRRTWGLCLSLGRWDPKLIVLSFWTPHYRSCVSRLATVP